MNEYIYRIILPIIKKCWGFEKYFSQEKGSAGEEVCEALG
jgi:hypothetical protein